MVGTGRQKVWSKSKEAIYGWNHGVKEDLKSVGGRNGSQKDIIALREFDAIPERFFVSNIYIHNNVWIL